MVTIKKGASFRVALKFDTAEEWDVLFPADYVVSHAKFGTQTFPMEVDVDLLSQSIYIRADTDEWPLGEGAFDIVVVSGDLKQTLPEISNIAINVVEGITQ